MEVSLTGLLLGLAVGVILGLTGAGGAILSVPLLGFFLHLTVVEAAPIGLLAVTLSAGLGAFLAFRARILRYKAAALMAALGILFSPLGIWIAHQLPNAFLVFIFCLVLLLVAKNMWSQASQELNGVPDEVGPPCLLDETIGKLTWTLPCARSLAASGSVAGFLSGLLGVGGGFVIVPALRKFTDLPMKSIVATSLGVLTLVSLSGVLFSNLYGAMNWVIAIPFAVGSIAGLLIARQWVTKISGPRVQQAFSILALSIALIMLFNLIHTF
ncbi:sulfite exporter TauE/SafE family protein [Polynucleobacter sp. 30F-ANTBAC]|uniref:sulfite exporter TauE/SafE family protein n=1 Tax=Polynucleobacter sp. 30F-ANTBAC TaxID=2689095 RepID=UPI001C0B7B41|nr:sulfite exporter TauE/SafE family protein [Polynucleobacter sp. 30F-ANTBAC]MBU3598977.1 sulfite exporter TauE/SafE family protein [Polynucleobacter sp. 30F-ANTBAC]